MGTFAVTYGFGNLFTNSGWGERHYGGDRGRHDKDHGRGHDDRSNGDPRHGGWNGPKDDCDDCYSVKIEAEDMHRWNYSVEKSRDAFGEKVVKLCGDYGKIWTTFSGPSGNYDLKLNYIDESDGKGWIKIFVGDDLVKSFRLDDQNGGTSITLEDVPILKGETIKIYGYSDCGEYTRIDSLEINACDPNAPPKFVNVGDACVDVEVAENSTVVFDLDASDRDGDALSYAISGGPDAALFVIDARTGEISFRQGPDFEAPNSRDGDNVYEIEVTVTDGEGGKDAGCLKIEVTDVDDTPKPGDDCTFTLSYCGLDVAITLTELSDGSIRFDVEVPAESRKIGDLRGLFFHLSDESKIPTLAVSGDAVTDASFREDRVSDLGNGANVNGLGRFDAGIEFGTAGLRDDVRSTSFVLSAEGALTLDDFRYQDFAVRLTSVGWEGGWRCDAVKMEGNAGPLECDCACDTCAEGFTKLTFDDLARGTVASDHFELDGVIISAERAEGSGNAAMVFDSSKPTGGDRDLATRNQGNLLIISEDDDSADPDDNWSGGKIVFTFPTLAEVDELVVVDVEERGGTIDLFDVLGQKIGSIAIPAGADGSIQTIGIDAEGVARMEVNLVGSGAVDDLCFRPGEGQGSLGGIQGELWCDKDEHDGLDLEVDNGVGGRTVTLYDEAGDAVATTTTAKDGSYAFVDLADGAYSVGFSAQGFTLRDTGSDDAIDSDVDATGRTGSVLVQNGTVVSDVDAGLVCFETNDDGLLGIKDAIDRSLSQPLIQIVNDVAVGTSYDAASDVLEINTALGRQVSIDPLLSTPLRMKLSLTVDEAGNLTDPAGDADFFIWHDADGDTKVGAGEEIYVEGDVVMFGAQPGIAAFFMDFAVLSNGGSRQDLFPDLIGLEINAELAGASDGFASDFATPNAKGLVLGNLAYDCLC